MLSNIFLLTIQRIFPKVMFKILKNCNVIMYVIKCNKKNIIYNLGPGQNSTKTKLHVGTKTILRGSLILPE